LNKDLGQHFLIDETVLESIVEAADIKSDDRIVEIGPGIGVLTAELMKKTPHVTCIEIDQRFPPLIKAFIGDGPQPVIIQDNALNVPFPTEPYKIVANIPYHITSPLLRHAFLENTQSPISLTLLIQKEVAQKICETHDRSLLTIIVGLFGTPKIMRKVPPSAFLPPPAVDSAVLHIDCFKEPLTDKKTMERVFVLTKHAFSQKRKMLRNTISDLPGGTEAMDTLGIDKERRPQTLTVEEWIKLAEAMKS
jgi:16S rRNA (adenine1518-N6/adenine1519-N6)-dimethyltransferase